MTLYQIFSFLDYTVYSMVKYVVRLILLIANADFFSQEAIKSITDKVYVVLGVLVLFKIVISCVQYMVNPDVFDDKDKGMVGILKNTIICMGLLVLIRPVFTFALRIQTTVVSTIPGLVLGDGTDSFRLDQSNSSSIREEIDSIGDLVASSTIWSFVVLKDNTEPQYQNVKISAALKDWDQDVTGKNKTLSSFREKITEGCEGGGVLNINLNASSCSYEYRIFISTVAGLFLLYILVSMTIDVGIRTIKLGILQILAPIPIGSYIVSKEKFNKFVKLSVKVYLDLFVRLAVIYFIIFFVRNVVNSLETVNIANGNYTPDTLDRAFIRVVINIALFMFAKNAPKFICEALGIDGGGFGDMADMFKPAWQRAGGAVGAALNPLTTAIANVNKSRQNGEKGIVTKLRRAAAGLGRGTFDAFSGMAAGDDWSKMRERHDKAVQKSSERSLAHANRVKNREQAGEKKKALAELKEKLHSRKSLFVKSFDRDQAQKNLDARKQELKDLEEKISATPEGEERNKLIEEYNSKANEIKDEKKFLEREAIRVAAERQVQEKAKPYREQIQNAKKQIENIDSKLKAGGLSAHEVAELESQKLDLQNSISDAESKIDGITHEKSIAEAKAKMDNATATINRVNGELNTVNEQKTAAQTEIGVAQASLIAAQNHVSANNQRIAAIDAELASVSSTDERYTELLSQKNALLAENGSKQTDINNIQAKIRTKQSEISAFDTQISQLNEEKSQAINAEVQARNAYNAQEQQYEAAIQEFIDEYDGIDDLIAKHDKELAEIEEVEKTTRKSLTSAKISGFTTYLGQAPASGKGYMDLSSFLGSSRSSIYTGEAMTKLRQNADVLVDVDGKPVTYTSRFCQIPDKRFSYEEMRSLLNDVQSNKITIEELKKIGFNSSAALQSAFEDLEKSAAADYINANLAQVNTSVRNSVKVRLKPGTQTNSAVVEWFDDFAADLYKNGASKTDLDWLYSKFQENPGKFMKDASGYKDTYASIGKKIVDSQTSDGGKK